MADVTGMRWGERGVNPIDHHGTHDESEFSLSKEHGARDFKDNVTYSPTSFVLAASGERTPRAPNGPLSPREHLAYWKYCKDKGLVPDTDPIPYPALCYVATEAEDIDCNEDDLIDPDVSGYRRPPWQAENAALNIVQTKLNLKPGRDSHDRMPTWMLRAIAYDAGHDPKNDVWRDTETGRAIADTPHQAASINDETDTTLYRALPARIHNLVLDILDEAGRGNDHGRKLRSVTDDLPIRGQ